MSPSDPGITSHILRTEICRVVIVRIVHGDGQLPDVEKLGGCAFFCRPFQCNPRRS